MLEKGSIKVGDKSEELLHLGIELISYGGAALINYLAPPNSKGNSDLIIEYQKKMIEVMKKVKEKMGDDPVFYHTMKNFLGPQNEFGVDFTRQNPCKKAWPSEEDKKAEEYSAEELYLDAKKLELEYNSTNPERPINVNEVRYNGTLVGYKIDGLGTETQFCSLQKYLPGGFMDTEKGNALSFSAELRSGPIEGITEEIYRECLSTGVEFSQGIKNLLVSSKRQKNPNCPSECESDDLFGGEDYGDLEQRLGITLKDMWIESGHGSKQKAFERWLEYADYSTALKMQEL